MPNVERVNILELLEAECEDARRWAVRLEGELAAARTGETLLLASAAEAIEQRDALLGRLATSNGQMAAFRHQRDQARAERDEVVAALADLVDEAMLDLVLGVPARKARHLVERYQRLASETGVER